MTTLHIVRQSAFVSDDFSQCINVLNYNDTVAFIDDGCYNMQHKLIKTIDINIQLQVLVKHAQSRALTINEDVFSKITMVNLVELTFSNDRVITW